MSLTIGEEEFLADCLREELAKAKDAGASDGQIVSAFLTAMAEVSQATLRVKVDYPEATPKRKRVATVGGRPSTRDLIAASRTRKRA